MNDTLHYKGYYASVHFNAQERIFFGKIQGVEELILFHAGSLADLKAAFLEAVESYIATSRDISAGGSGNHLNNHSKESSQ